MGDLWIDVYEVGGGADVYPDTRIGAGPITSVLSWESTARLDGVGDFAFTMPAADPKAASLANRRVVWCWRRNSQGKPLFVGAGIITRMVWETGTPTVLRVSGPDLLQELAECTVKKLNVLEQDWAYLTDGDGTVRLVSDTSEQDLPNAYDGSLTSETASFNITGEGGWWLYIGYDARFDRIRFNLGTTKNDHYAGMQWQYYSDTSPAGWRNLTVTDGTMDGTSPFAQDGDVTFTRPTDWERCGAIEYAPDWFYIRVRRYSNLGDEFDLSLKEVRVYADVATTKGVQQIMAYAPSAWGVSTSQPLTTAAHYVSYDGDSVLGALITLAERGGQEP